MLVSFDSFPRVERDLKVFEKDWVWEIYIQKSDRLALKTGGATHTNHNQAKRFFCSVVLCKTQNLFIGVNWLDLTWLDLCTVFCVPFSRGSSYRIIAYLILPCYILLSIAFIVQCAYKPPAISSLISISISNRQQQQRLLKQEQPSLILMLIADTYENDNLLGLVIITWLVVVADRFFKMRHAP